LTITEQQLKELAKEGLTQSQAARRLEVSRQHISRLANSLQIEFTIYDARKPPVRIECPRCKRVKELSAHDARRRKTPYCAKCQLIATGNWRKGVDASPRTKKKL
jgi:endogenous inhibitor of DNA gyrase (YacG/DUF329 family)